MSQNKQNVNVLLDSNGNVTNYKYQIIFVDEYNNFYLVGFYNDLKEAEQDVNTYLEGYEYDDWDNEEYIGEPAIFGDDTPLGHLEEYAGSFSPVIDRIIDTTVGEVQVRGFVFK